MSIEDTGLADEAQARLENLLVTLASDLKLIRRVRPQDAKRLAATIKYLTTIAVPDEAADTTKTHRFAVESGVGVDGANGKAQPDFASVEIGRQNLMLAFAILRFLEIEKESVTIGILFKKLLDAELIDGSGRPALVTRLGRMKKNQFLDWNAREKPAPIAITPKGLEYCALLGSRKLRTEERDALKSRAPWTA